MQTRELNKTYRAYQRSDLRELPQLQKLSKEQLLGLQAVSAVLPFRVNNYVIEKLIDWDAIPHDPIFQLTFPQPAMLDPDDFRRMRDLVAGGAPEAEVRAAAREIQFGLNPHPAGQMDLNVPELEGERLRGMQHKYRETVLFFPSRGQTCHAYCTYCFRWAQFVGIEELKFDEREADSLVRYLRAHPDVTDVLITGGDPLIMTAAALRRYVEPLLDIPTLRNIRIGTKAPGYWPQRFVTDRDADSLLRLFESIVERDKHFALMAHYSHPRELETDISREAVRRIRDTGATIRCQTPLIRHVNDAAEIWMDMWKQQVSLGAVPYYMFVERDTGPKEYFRLPLARAYGIFQEAYTRVSGLGRTVRGPSMSATPGKVLIEGIATVAGEKVFVLKFIQARRASWMKEVFFARYDEEACWLDDLRPAFGGRDFFFEDEQAALSSAKG